jgi:hypothetical protein
MFVPQAKIYHVCGLKARGPGSVLIHNTFITTKKRPILA